MNAKPRPVWQCHPITKSKIALHNGPKAVAIALTGSDSIQNKVSMAARGKRQSAGGFAWKFADSELNDSGESWRSLDITGLPGDAGYRISNTGQLKGPTGHLHKECVSDEGYRICGIKGKKLQGSCFGSSYFSRQPPKPPLRKPQRWQQGKLLCRQFGMGNPFPEQHTRRIKWFDAEQNSQGTSFL